MSTFRRKQSHFNQTHTKCTHSCAQHRQQSRGLISSHLISSHLISSHLLRSDIRLPVLVCKPFREKFKRRRWLKLGHLSPDSLTSNQIIMLLHYCHYHYCYCYYHYCYHYCYCCYHYHYHYCVISICFRSASGMHGMAWVRFRSTDK
jgi:hypothetical protein